MNPGITPGSSRTREPLPFLAGSEVADPAGCADKPPVAGTVRPWGEHPTREPGARAGSLSLPKHDEVICRPLSAETQRAIVSVIS